MQARVRALVISPSAEPQTIYTCTDLRSLQAIVGGDLEFVCLTEEIHAYVNEDGRRLKLAANGQGSDIVNRFHPHGYTEHYTGTMIFLSIDDEGNEACLTDAHIACICQDSAYK
jgi:hypothetical protein